MKNDVDIHINEKRMSMTISTYKAYSFWSNADQKTSLFFECIKKSWPCDAGNDEVMSTVDHLPQRHMLFGILGDLKYTLHLTIIFTKSYRLCDEPRIKNLEMPETNRFFFMKMISHHLLPHTLSWYFMQNVKFVSSIIPYVRVNTLRFDRTYMCQTAGSSLLQKWLVSYLATGHGMNQGLRIVSRPLRNWIRMQLIRFR